MTDTAAEAAVVGPAKGTGAGVQQEDQDYGSGWKSDESDVIADGKGPNSTTAAVSTLQPLSPTSGNPTTGLTQVSSQLVLEEGTVAPVLDTTGISSLSGGDMGGNVAHPVSI